MIAYATRSLSILALGAAISLTAWAGSVSRADAQAQVTAAVGHVKKVGVEQAKKDFNTAPEWKANGMNVIFNEMNGLVLASSLNERLVGKQTYEMKDPAGKAFVKEFEVAAKKGDGWVDYQFINPETKKLEERSMYVRRIPSFEGYIGVAITK